MIGLPLFRGQLPVFLELAAPEKAAYILPEARGIDPEPIRRLIEHGMVVSDTPHLPAAFNWKLVATNLARSIRTCGRRDLAGSLAVAIAEESAAAVSRLVPLDPGFRLVGYRDSLRRKCGGIALSALHASTYDLPHDLLRQLSAEGHMTSNPTCETFNEETLLRLLETYTSAPAAPVGETIQRDDFRHSVIQEPGSGKFSYAGGTKPQNRTTPARFVPDPTCRESGKLTSPRGSQCHESSRPRFASG